MGSSDGDAFEGAQGDARRAFLALLAARTATDAGSAGDIPDAPAPDATALADIRETFGLSAINTVAAAGTNIAALAGKPFVGLSPALRREAGLPTLDEHYGADRPIQSPNTAFIASRHAEEDILNAVHADIEAAGLSEADLEGRTVNVHISNETGICHFCFGGLGASKGKDGVIKQFSLMYPMLTLRITAEGADARRGIPVVLVKNGELVG